MRILMVDDEPYMRWLYADLQSAGHEVIWARGGEEARDYMAKQDFDMAIVDVLMPAPPDSPNPEGESHVLGLRLCKDILKTSWGKRSRVVVLSVLTEDELRDRAIQVGLAPDRVSFCSKEPFPDMKVFLEGAMGNSGGS